VISFRYHLVSIIGVFLALALGIVVGTTALNGPITTDLRKQVNNLKNDRVALANQVKALQSQVGDAGAFAEQFGTQIVQGTLTKKNVLMIGMPGASNSTEDGIEKQITAAGGKLTRLDMTSSYVDQRRGSDITSLVTTVHPIGLTYPEVNDPGQLAGALLAYVLLGKGQSSDLQQVLGGFSELHMLSVGGGGVRPTTAVVIVGSGGLQQGSYPAQMELALVSSLQRAGGNVVVAGNGSSATDSGLIADVRGSSAVKSSVSTVDNADTAIGQVSAVLAVGDALSSSYGHYGTARGAVALFPNIGR
jgi:hypothetical protein